MEYFFMWFCYINISKESTIALEGAQCVCPVLIPRNQDSLLFTITDKVTKGSVRHSDGFTHCDKHSGVERGQAPSLSFQWQFNNTHHTRVRQGGTCRKPRCHGRSALTSSVGYTHPTMTVSSLWCGSQACLFFGNPLKVALDGKLTKRPQCYYRSTLGWVLIWWVCK